MNSPHGTILLVDDDANDIFLMQRAFKKVGLQHAVRTVVDGEEAIEFLSGRGRYSDRAGLPAPVLIVLDLKVPRISGIEILEWIRRQPGMKRVPVVVMTSAADEAEINLAYERGANSYLVKPLGFERLLEMVRALSHYWLVLNEPSEGGSRPPERDTALAT